MTDPNAEILTTIENTVHDLAVDLLDFGRRDDEELPRGVIEDSIEAGILTIEEMVVWFRNALNEEIQVEG
jgi:hypothetical protein